MDDTSKYEVGHIASALAVPDAITNAKAELRRAAKIDTAFKVNTLDEERKVKVAMRTLATRDAYELIVKTYGDPLDELAKIGFDKEVDVAIRVSALKEVAGYGHSKLKTIEHTGAGGEPLEFKMTLVQNILNMMTPAPEVTVTEAP